MGVNPEDLGRPTLIEIVALLANGTALTVISERQIKVS